ncbi:MAG: hypothetical protein HRF50_15420 [Phycisphaerae bacterium]|jgi:hypothetical protein
MSSLSYIQQQQIAPRAFAASLPAALDPQADGDWIIASFMGTSVEDAGIQGHNPSVIWSSLVVWTP